MRCEDCREALSALLDEEHPGVDPGSIDDHLAGCVACRSFERRLGELHRATRLRPAEPVPDLSALILGRISPRPTPVHDPILSWLRSGLTFVGLGLVLLATPLLFSDVVDTPAHLAAWDLAFGGALLVAAWQPDRARGLLPMALLVTISMTFASLIEINDGHPASHGLVFHLGELAGVLLLAAMARHRRVRPIGQVGFA